MWSGAIQYGLLGDVQFIAVANAPVGKDKKRVPLFIVAVTTDETSPGSSATSATICCGCRTERPTQPARQKSVGRARAQGLHECADYFATQKDRIAGIRRAIAEEFKDLEGITA